MAKQACLGAGDLKVAASPAPCLICVILVGEAGVLLGPLHSLLGISPSGHFIMEGKIVERFKMDPKFTGYRRKYI